ncbi:hypothetical protein LMG28727_07182 [Paraburkholderia kirstenboschensis]|nr:hypothetical protein LMG28727_07182 [Paraburkholderia kirstenboschensis]
MREVRTALAPGSVVGVSEPGQVAVIAPVRSIAREPGADVLNNAAVRVNGDRCNLSFTAPRRNQQCLIAGDMNSALAYSSGDVDSVQN